jgi:uncharacterized membrane protein
MTDDDKKEILSSDEKSAAKSTLGGAVAGAVVGTAVGTPVVGTLIGAVSGASDGRSQEALQDPADQTARKGKDIPCKKARSSQSYCQEVQVGAKAKDGNKVFKGFNTKGHEVGIASRPR